jgi:hypothetical protein
LVSVWYASAGTAGREEARTRSLGESKSRNKVSVGEPAEGSLSVFLATHSSRMQGKKLTQRTKTSLSNGRDRTKRRLPTDCPLRISFWGTYHTVLDATHGDGLSMLAGSPGSKSASKTAPDLSKICPKSTSGAAPDV